MSKITGKVWNFGANIDTDVIIAARYLNSSDQSIWQNMLWKMQILSFQRN